MNVLSLFDGISCGQLALRRAGIAYDKYYASEINPHAIKVTMHHFPDTIQLGDVQQLDVTKLPKIDLLIGGPPCQGFSVSGKRLNFDDPRSKLVFDYIRILKELQPTYFLMENVRMKNEVREIIDDLLGVKSLYINSSLVSAQTRPRLYWTNIPNVSIPDDKGIVFGDIMDHSDRTSRPLPEMYNAYNTKNYTQYMLASSNHPKSNSNRLYRVDRKMGCVTAGSRYPKLQLTDSTCRPINVLECERLQTLPDGYTSMLGNYHRMQAIGNGWTVDVIAHILKHIKGVSND